MMAAARILVVIALLAAPVLPAAAIEYASSRYANECRAKVPKATCDCIIGRMAATQDGRFALEVYEVIDTPQAERRAVLLDLLNRFGMRASDAQAAVERLRSGAEPMVKACI